MERTISMMVGKVSLNHNNRKFTAKNVDSERSKCNKVYVKKSIKQVYHALFDEVLEAYNSKQTRADRRLHETVCHQWAEYAGAFSGVYWRESTKFFREYRFWWQEQVVVVGMTETDKDNLYYPDLKLPEGTRYNIGKYGLMRWEYLKANHRAEYLRLLLDGKLNEYLHEVDEECHARVELIVEQMKARVGITEELKATEPMKWVGLMNNARDAAEEIVLRDLVYV